MKKFIDEDFLLENEVSRTLFNEYAKKCPIYDYHCHLSPKEIAENKSFKNLTEMWLYGDHYKWRAMRSNGINEEYITGNASDYDKFISWAKTMPKLIGNPLYHWSHLELKRYFNIDEVLNEKTAKSIWDMANEKIKTLSVKDILKSFKVYAIGTTDDPSDSLEYHRLIKEGNAKIGKIETLVVPSFRPDKAINIDMEGFADYIKKLEEAASEKINSVGDLLKALIKRLDYFISLGCVATDHALENVPFALSKEEEVNEIFLKAISGKILETLEIEKYKTYILINLAKEYSKNNIAMQIHLSAMRNNNTKMFIRLGADTGYDTIGDSNIAKKLSCLLNELEKTDSLPKTIFYSLNNKDYYTLSALMGCFQGGMQGKMQLGSAWWFLDTKDGMEEQMKTLANVGLLSLFIGMLTDSRSFLSYTRHEYFRRILCNLLGSFVEKGEAPYDLDLLGSIVENICFNNAKAYFLKN